MMSIRSNGRDCDCPPRSTMDKRNTLTFSNCVPVAGSSTTVGNIVFQADPDIDITIAGSFENTGNVGFNALIVFNSGPSVNLSVEPGDSATFVFNDVREIALFSFGGAYTGIFKYQVTYTVI